MSRKRYTAWLGAVTIVMLGGLAILAPQVNAASGPPRSVFVPWPETAPVPAPSVVARQSAGGGWVLDITAPGFTFSEVCRTTRGPQAIGHAHVYLGEEKITAAYAPRVWLDPLPPGRHQIRVVLRAQDHRALVGPKGLVSATVLIEAPEV